MLPSLLWYVKRQPYFILPIVYLLMKKGGYAALIYYEPNDILTFTAVRSIQLPALLKVNYKCTNKTL